MKVLWIAATLAFTTALLSSSHGKADAQPVNGLQMSITPAQQPSATEQATQFAITFTNTTKADLTFAPGTLIFCGVAPSKTSAVLLNLTDPKGKLHRNMGYLGDGPPYVGGCGGRIDLFIVTLRPHESVALPLDISKYFDLKNLKQYEGARFPAGSYLVEAHFTSSSDPIPNVKSHWFGTVKSNIVPVQFHSIFSAPLDDYPDHNPPTTP
jgi:hypothetical protein